mmetsp:Transcript_60107/g.159897  ORF Transcript_60107/g.159897 Transcript_60107/m.159897 type:complete len:200 (-) Transcript_60107:1256-1855(-)
MRSVAEPNSWYPTSWIAAICPPSLGIRFTSTSFVPRKVRASAAVCVASCRASSHSSSLSWSGFNIRAPSASLALTSASDTSCTLSLASCTIWLHTTHSEASLNEALRSLALSLRASARGLNFIISSSISPFALAILLSKKCRNAPCRSTPAKLCFALSRSVEPDVCPNWDNMSSTRSISISARLICSRNSADSLLASLL